MSLAPPPHPSPPQHPELPDGIERRRSGRELWSPWLSVVALVTAFLVASIFGLFVFGLSGGDIDDPPPAASIIATLIQDAILIGVALAFAGMAARPRPADFGLRGTRFWPAVGWTLLAYGAFIGVSAAWLSLVGANAEEELPSELGADESTVAAIAVAFLVCVAAPLVEEFFFRGYLYGAMRRWGVPVAALVVGLLFGAVHAGGSDVAFLVPLAVLGAILCLLYEKTGSLYPSIALHLINNTIAFSVALDYSWQIPVIFVSSSAMVVATLFAVRRRLG